MNQPDYNGSSIVNLMASIRQLYTLPSMYAPLSTLDLSEFEQTDNLVLFLIDGLGETTYHQFCEQSPIAPYFRNCLTSVFPTTTAARGYLNLYRSCPPKSCGAGMVYVFARNGVNFYNTAWNHSRIENILFEFNNFCPIDSARKFAFFPISC